MDKKKKVIKKKPAKKLVKKTIKKVVKSSIKSTKDKSVKVNVNVNASGGSGGGGTSVPQPVPQMVYQAQRDRGEDDLINKFNNLLNKAGSKPSPDKPTVVDMGIKEDVKEFNKKIYEGSTQIDNPIFSEESNKIKIVRKSDLSNRTILENINTPKTDDEARQVNEPDVDEVAVYINKPDLLKEINEQREKLKKIPKKEVKSDNNNEIKKQINEKNKQRELKNKQRELKNNNSMVSVENVKTKIPLKIKEPSSKINEQEFITVENTPEKQKTRSSSAGFTMYPPKNTRSQSAIDNTRYKTPSRQEMRALRIPSSAPMGKAPVEQNIKIQMPALPPRIESTDIKPIKVKSEIKQLDNEIKLKNNELTKIVVEKNNAPHGSKGKFDDSIKKLRQEIKSLTLNKEIKVNKRNM